MYLSDLYDWKDISIWLEYQWNLLESDSNPARPQISRPHLERRFLGPFSLAPTLGVVYFPPKRYGVKIVTGNMCRYMMIWFIWCMDMYGIIDFDVATYCFSGDVVQTGWNKDGTRVNVAKRCQKFFRGKCKFHAEMNRVLVGRCGESGHVIVPDAWYPLVN